MRSKSVLILSLCFLFVACAKNTSIPGQLTDSTSSGQSDTSRLDIYAVGGEGSVAKYWKNGVAVTLNGGSYATGIAVSGSDVYVCGYGVMANDHYAAMYWKNGVAVNLTDGSTTDAMGNSIMINGSDVYVAGQEAKAQVYTWAAKYWKNGQPVVLTDVATEYGVAENMAFLGSDLYVVGHRRQISYPYSFNACYWKNGVGVDLSDTTTSAEWSDMAVSGSDLYLAWSVSYNDSGYAHTYYSKNLGPATTVEDESGIYGTGLATSGSDVYISGYGFNALTPYGGAEYWKNGQFVLAAVTSGTTSYSNSVAINGSDVYLGGYQDGINGGYWVACYWKNGQLVKLTDGTQNASVSKILVVAK